MADATEPGHPIEPNLSKFAKVLPDILQQTDHDEMFGVKLRHSSDQTDLPQPTLNILQKFLRANANDLDLAKTQLIEALKWRKSYNPLASMDETFDADRFGALGFVTTISSPESAEERPNVVTYNVYGAAMKDVKKTFGDIDDFVRWRVALMELTLAELHLPDATEPIPEYQKGRDPYQAIQVHDYLSVSFFRQPAEIKASSSKIIDLFQRYYPETVFHKYFVNVPLVMQWLMGAMKAILSKDTIQKMTWMTDGSQLSQYVGSDVPKAYGGSGPDLTEKGLTPKYAQSTDK